MKPRTTQQAAYSHAQWKTEYDALSQSLEKMQTQNTTQQEDIQKNIPHNDNGVAQKNVMDTVNQLFDLIEKKKQLEIVGTHYDFYSQPHILCARLIRDTRQLLATYDLMHPANQSDFLRYTLQEIHNTMNKIESSTRFLLETENNIAAFQYHYETLCAQLAMNASELRHNEIKFFEKFRMLLTKYTIAIPSIHFVDEKTHGLSGEESASLQHAEKIAYTKAVNQLRKEINKKPQEKNAVKNSCLELITRSELIRAECEKKTCSLNKKPFDYKRHTINLTKTYQLLKSPRNQVLQHEYQTLINNNPSTHDTRFKACMAIFFGALMIALGLTITPIQPVGIIMAIGGGVSLTGGATLFANTFKPNTTTHMSDIYKNTVRPSNRS